MNVEPPVQSKKKYLLIIITVAILLRAATALYLGDQVVALPGTADQISYHTLALRVLDGHGFSFGEFWWPATKPDAPTAHWSFLYTGFLVAVYALFGSHALAARLVQAVLVGLLHPLLAYLIARRVVSEKVALITAGLTAGYIYFFYYAATLMTEPFYITGILASFYLGMRLADRLSTGAKLLAGGNRKLTIGLGLSLGATILLRQLFLLLVPLFLLWLWWVGKRKALAPIVVVGGLIAAMILPFTIYNYLRFDRFVLLNTNAGYAFYWGNHPIYGTHFIPILPSEEYMRLLPLELKHLDEAALDQALLKRGFQFITDDPGRYLKLSLSRIPPYFEFWPSSESDLFSNLARVASFGVLLPFMLYGALRTLVRGSSVGYPGASRDLGLLYLFIGGYPLIHILTWTLIRYRLPVDAILLIFAGQGIYDLAGWLTRRRQSSPQPV